ncbi:MAG: SDR family oxidoreductase [Magnetococcales bacterium]|nr:SDR family oxidoreductase [Magnetococcales bacterium]
MTSTLVVTGASRGLGRHVAEQALVAGYQVLGLSRQPPADAPFPIQACDVADPDAVQAALAPLKRDSSFFGLVNAAGIASMNLTLFTPPATAARILAVNLLGTIHCCQVAGRFLARWGRGRIINFSTIAVPLAIEGEAIYAASKAGVETFSRIFAREMAPHGVTVNVVAPGPIATDLIARVPAERIQAIVERQVVPRPGTPQDVWHAVQLLLSPQADMISGQVIHVGGV